MNEIIFQGEIETFTATLEFGRDGLPRIGSMTMLTLSGKAYPVQTILDYQEFLAEVKGELEVMLNIGPE